MSDQPSLPVPQWTVLRVEDVFAAGTAGTFGPAKRVVYRVLDGSESYVDVPVADYKPSTVEKLIQDAVDRHIEVVTLEGPAILPVSPPGG